MRKAMVVLVVLGLVGTIWAADPTLGTWKLNIAKSKLTPSEAQIKELTWAKREIGDQFEIIFTGIGTDGETFTYKIMAPIKGGVCQSDVVAKDGMMVTTVISSGEWYVTSLLNGKQVGEGHYVLSKDGKTINRTSKAIDAQGNLNETLMVFDKQ